MFVDAAVGAGRVAVDELAIGVITNKISVIINKSV
jgi:hypothetical protein